MRRIIPRLVIALVVFAVALSFDIPNRKQYGDAPWLRKVQVQEQIIRTLQFEPNSYDVTDENGQTILTMDVTPKSAMGGYRVPVRFFFEGLGFEVDYSNVLQPTITIKPDGEIIKEAVVIHPDEMPYGVFEMDSGAGRYFVYPSTLTELYPRAISQDLSGGELRFDIDVGELLVSVKASNTMTWWDWFIAILLTMTFFCAFAGWAMISRSKGRAFGHILSLGRKGRMFENKELTRLQRWVNIINSEIVVGICFLVMAYNHSPIPEFYWTLFFGTMLSMPYSAFLSWNMWDVIQGIEVSGKLKVETPEMN